MKSRIRFILLLGLLLLSLSLTQPLAAQQGSGPPQVGLRPDAPTYAIRGPYWVGYRDFEIADPAGTRPLPVTVWYPALNAAGTENFTPYDTGYGDLGVPSVIDESRAFAEAAPDMQGAPYPLVVISHGLGGSRYGYFVLVEHLASRGFVVVAVEHIGTATRDSFAGTADVGDPNNIASLHYRPADIMRTTAYADTLTAAGGLLAGVIDTDHIAVWGHSTGGTTAFQAGGARIDLQALKTWCADKRTEEFAAESCQFVGHESELGALYGIDQPETTLFPALWDSRVDAIVTAAPGGELHAFGDDGIAAVQVPNLTMYGTLDPFVKPEYNALWAYGQISSREKALVTFENGGHVIFANCPAMFAEFCGYDNVWDLSRVDDLNDYFTTAFLLAVLKGDQEARAALAPDAVSFPGISYQAQGF